MIGAQSMAPAAPKFVSWVDRRHVRVASAIAFLRARGILVTVVDRDAQVRQYLVTGRRYRQLAEDVIDLAIAKGWSE